MLFWASLPTNSWLDPPALSLQVLSGIGSSQPVVLGFHSRMEMGSHQCSERSRQNPNHMLSFACRHQSKKRRQCPRRGKGMSLTPLWKRTLLHKRCVVFGA